MTRKRGIECGGKMPASRVASQSNCCCWPTCSCTAATHMARSWGPVSLCLPSTIIPWCYCPCFERLAVLMGPIPKYPNLYISKSLHWIKLKYSSSSKITAIKLFPEFPPVTQATTTTMFACLNTSSFLKVLKLCKEESGTQTGWEELVGSTGLCRETHSSGSSTRYRRNLDGGRYFFLLVP